MTIRNPRVNVSMDPQHMKLLCSIAKQEEKSLSMIARELIIDAIERREDLLLSSIAKQREDNNNGSLISHEDAWKQ